MSRKYEPGEVIDAKKVLEFIADGKPIYYNHKWYHSGWARGWRIGWVLGQAGRGMFRSAVEL